MDRFQNFSELKKHAKDSMDFVIETRKGESGFAIMAPHGGGIEPGTDVVADAIAGTDHFYYAFRGIRAKNNTPLHIPSSRFDEPRAMALVRQCHTIVTIHGCRDIAPVVYVGGKNDVLKKQVSLNLRAINILVRDAVRPSIKGVHQNNLCNRGSRGQGVQLEISNRVRRELIGQGGWQYPRLTPPLRAFTQAVRQAISHYLTFRLS